MRTAYLLLFFVSSACSMLWGQTDVQQQLHDAARLVQQGEFNKVIEMLPKLIDSTRLNAGETGQAWMILAFAHQERGDFMLSETAYEHSLALLSNEPRYAESYAAALDNFSDLYRTMNKLETAKELQKRAIDTYERLHSHAALAKSYSNLAGLELSQKHRRDVSKYLSRSLQEAKLAGGLDDDFSASISSNQAWLAELSGDKQGAISGYERALDLWRHQHGEEHMLTGWGYMVLGKAYAEAGKNDLGLDDMRKGLDILGRTAGQSNPKYLAGEIAYSRVLDHAGNHSDAVRIKKSAEQELASLYGRQCIDCRVSAMAAFH